MTFPSRPRHGVEFPVRKNFEQPRTLDAGGMDLESDQRSHTAVEPGQFEESTEEDLRKRFWCGSERVTIPFVTRTRDMPDGTKKVFPEGSVVLELPLNPDFPWPPYRWPEESLEEW
ncbi:hypothetical protein F4818DRAFT_446805 [Hypoxylon cercidicola]|nr:hypothetical protein F4818DRAFT_446805 [Hypoxylon cercidicola]